MSQDHISLIAERLKAERLAAIEANPQYAGVQHDPASQLRKQQAIQRAMAEVDNAVDLARRGNW